MPGDSPPDRPEGPQDPRPWAGPISEHLLQDVSRAVWRPITWPLGASRLFLPSPTRSGATSWRESWLEATKWWTEALGAGSRLGAEASAAMLVELAEGLARAFRGRRVGVEVGGWRVAAELDSIWLERNESGYRGRIELRSVDCDGFQAEALSVLADDVALTTQPAVALIMSGIEIRGRSALEPLLARLDQELSEWDLCVAENDLIQAAPRRGSGRFLLRAEVRDGELEAELRAMRFRGMTLRCPYWLRLTRKRRLPSFPAGVSVAEARQRETGIEFRLSTPSYSQAFDLDRVRQAIFSAASDRSA